MTLIIILTFFASSVFAQETTKIQPKQDELIVKVNGIVCSFCAYGAEKNLKRLSFVDRSKYGDDGILIELEKGYIAIALEKGKPIDFIRTHQAITKGGYSTVSAYIQLVGILNEENGTYYLENEWTAQNVWLNSDKTDELKLLIGQKIIIDGKLDVNEIEAMEEGKPLSVNLLTWKRD